MNVEFDHPIGGKVIIVYSSANLARVVRVRYKFPWKQLFEKTALFLTSSITNGLYLFKTTLLPFNK